MNDKEYEILLLQKIRKRDEMIIRLTTVLEMYDKMVKSVFAVIDVTAKGIEDMAPPPGFADE